MKQQITLAPQYLGPASNLNPAIGGINAAEVWANDFPTRPETFFNFMTTPSAVRQLLADRLGAVSADGSKILITLS